MQEASVCLRGRVLGRKCWRARVHGDVTKRFWSCSCPISKDYSHLESECPVPRLEVCKEPPIFLLFICLHTHTHTHTHRVIDSISITICQQQGKIALRTNLSNLPCLWRHAGRVMAPAHTLTSCRKSGHQVSRELN